MPPWPPMSPTRESKWSGTMASTVTYPGASGKKRDSDEFIPSILEPVEDPYFSGEESSKDYKRNWARLIQKIYEVDPLTCFRCSGKMKIISVIEDEEVIKKILKHLGLWEIKERPPPKANSPPMTPEYHIDYTDSQLPVSDNYLYVDPQYLSEA